MSASHPSSSPRSTHVTNGTALPPRRPRSSTEEPKANGNANEATHYTDKETAWLTPILTDMERLGLKGHYHREFPLSNLLPANSEQAMLLQVRGTHHRAKPTKVAEYRVLYETNTPMPPLICDRDGTIIDGNTRRDGGEQARKAFLPVIQLTVSFSSAAEDVRQRIVQLGAWGNTGNGDNLAKDDRRKHARNSMINPGCSIPEVMSRFGLSHTTCVGIQQEIVARARIAKLFPDNSVDPDHDFTKNGIAALQRIGTPTFAHLNDAPAKELILLIVAAQLKRPDIDALVQQCHDAGNDHDAIYLLRDKREGELADQIKAVKDTGRGTAVRAPSRLRQICGQINTHHDNPENFVEDIRREMINHREVVRLAIETLQRVEEAQSEEIDRAGLED